MGDSRSNDPRAGRAPQRRPEQRPSAPAQPRPPARPAQPAPPRRPDVARLPTIEIIPEPAPPPPPARAPKVRVPAPPPAPAEPEAPVPGSILVARPFVVERVRAAAVYCSDGRFGEHMDDFLHNQLQLPRYDRVAIPGGPACLGDHFETFREEDALERQLRLLITTHELNRVVLVGHVDCGYYKRIWLKGAPVAVRQLEDLQKAVRRVRGWADGLQVEAWMARLEPQGVLMRPVPA